MNVFIYAIMIFMQLKKKQSHTWALRLMVLQNLLDTPAEIGQLLVNFLAVLRQTALHGALDQWLVKTIEQPNWQP